MGGTFSPFFLTYFLVFSELNGAQQEAVRNLRDIPDDSTADPDWEMLDEVLEGTAPMGTSHAGGEFDVIQSLEEGLWVKSR